MVDTAPARSRTDIATDLAAARKRSDEITVTSADIAARKDAALESDTTFASWFREKMLAENEAVKVAAEIEALEEEDERAVEQEELQQFHRIYSATAARSEELVQRFRRDVPAAWQLLATVMRDVAELEADREILRRTMPANYEPVVRIAHVEGETRSPGASSDGRYFSPALNLPSFARDLRFPSFDGWNPAPLFDGKLVADRPQSILDALDAAERRAPRA